MFLRLTYTTLSLRRDNMSRKPAEWVAAQLSGSAGVVPVAGSKNLIVGGDTPHGVVFEGAPAQRIFEAATETVLLGTDDHKAVFAAAVDAATAAAIEADSGAQFIDIRQVGALLVPTEAHLLAHARGMIHWHSRHGFCGVCGAPTESRHAGHERHCLNPDCGSSHFPRTDPAIIVLVYRDDVPGGACLMGRNPRFPEGMYSTLAGFVEPGETLEQAVSREVFEESGIETTDVTYMASQPWPFPSSLMLGFHAKATSFDIDFDPHELADCRWFRRDEMTQMREWVDAAEGELRLPRRDSIARWLIQRWLDGG